MGYRIDIQLLRAFAVILVVLYHLKIPFFSKGFLGVDVFFVISGFLMAVLYKDGQPVDFLKRRVRRLLPPYVGVLLATMLVGMLMLLPNELSQLNEQSTYSVFFAANIGFWSEASYFSSSEFKPLLHLWTLGAEVQYYFFVPLILWLFRKHKLSILVLALGSFALCTVMLYVSPKTSFFMMPLRAWEFLIGAMTGLYFTDRGSVRNISYSWLGVFGIISLVAIQLLPVDGEKLSFMFGHPGLAALLTCIATMAVITFGLPVRVLKSNVAKPFVFVGQISYSIYLVHFPIITFYFYQPFEGTTLSNGGSADTLILIVAIVLFSLLSYYLIEKPGPKLNQGLLAGVAASIVAIFVIVSDTAINKRFSAYELGFLMANQDRGPYRCGKIARITDPTAKACLLSSMTPHARSVLLVGNSHADSIKIVFNRVAGLYGYNTYFIVENIPMMPGGMSVEQIINEAVSKDIKVIVTHYSPEAVLPQSYFSLKRAAAEKGIALAAIAPVPVYTEHIPKHIYHAYQNGQSVLPLQTQKEHVSNVASDLKILRDLSTKKTDGFSYYDPANYLCADNCKFISEDGRAWYFDNAHLTLTGSEQLVPLFKDIFNQFPPMEGNLPITRDYELPSPRSKQKT